MSFGDPNPNNPYGQPQGQPQQPPQPGYGYPQQAPQGVPPQQGMPPQPGYGYPQAPPVQPYGAGGYQQPGYGIQPQYAGWWSRAGALVLDALVIGIPYGVIVGIGGAIGGGAGSAVVVIGLLVGLGLGLFKLYKEGTTGQFIGKKALGISLLREADGRPMGFGMAFVRYLAHFLDSLACYIGWLWPAWDAKKQTFADKVCSSVVVKAG
ncbi:RDD family protein [Streptomyces sp. NPDC051322]|uniref:RDD family protein n=1 Tax=Streptomyces sp. NPDC051322 TaxID=3154645 RepID=UPI00344DA54E